MTTRKAAGRRLAFALAAACGALLSGCATPGPLHVYSLSRDAERPVLDAGPGARADAPSFLEPGERVTGFAYDPFTDHFFLRLEPGNRIRVVDRPARAIKREFEIKDAPARSAGDLAVSPRSGHLFLLGAPAQAVLETTRFGRLVCTITLADTAGAPSGLAFDSARAQLLALGADGRRVTIHNLDGARVAELTLAETVAASLGFDAEKRELYAPLRARPGVIGVFDETGRLARTVEGLGAFVDVGPRSLVRVF